MADGKIRVKFEADGSPALIAAIKALNKESNKYKEALRLQDWELEAKLYKWGMVGKPINPEVKRMRTDLILDQGQRAGGKDFVPNLNDMEAKIAEFKRMQ